MPTETLKDEIADIVRRHSESWADPMDCTYNDEEATADILRAIQQHYPAIVFDPPLSPG